METDYKQMVFTIDEQDRETWRGFFIWCSVNGQPLESDYTDFIAANNI